MTRKTKRDSNRHHEAAHAVVAYRLGYGIRSVTSGGKRKDGSYGVCRVENRDTLWLDWLPQEPSNEYLRSKMRRHLASLYAGYVAEHNYWGIPLSEPDDNIMMIALSDCWKAGDILELLGDDETEESELSEIQAAEQLAAEILKKNEAFHLAVVEALRQRPTLHREDFQAIADYYDNLD